MNRKKLTPTPFEAALKTLRPFMTGYSIADQGRIKLHIASDANPAQLDAALTALDEPVQRSPHAVFLRYGDMNAGEVQRIAKTAFSELSASHE